MVLAVLLGVFAFVSLGLLLNKLSLERQNRHWTEHSHFLEKILDRSKKQHRRLFQSVQIRQKQAKNLNTALDSMKKENDSLDEMLKKTQADIATVKEEKTYLEEMLIHKTQQIENLNAQINQAGDAPTGLVNIALPSSPNDEELRRLQEQNHLLQEKLNRLYKAINANINEINIAKIALEETVSSARKKIEDEWNTVNLGSVTTGAGAETPAASAVESKAPKTEGHVLAVNDEHGFVVIDLGRTDNLPPDAVLQVKKNGRSIATLSVLELRNAMAACNVKEVLDGQRIEINDPVSILR